MVEVVDSALPAVVLLLNTRPDGTTTYGAGLILGKDGRVLTNYHVIEGAKSLGAMLYKPGRVSYTPMDGGLSRYIFENQKDIVTTTLVAGDATSDLAIVKVDADTSKLPVLAFSKEKVRPGSACSRSGTRRRRSGRSPRARCRRCTTGRSSTTP